MDVNDNEGTRMYCGVCGFIASKLAPTKDTSMHEVKKTQNGHKDNVSAGSK